MTAEAWGAPDANVLHLDARNEVAHAESDHKKLNCFFPGLPRAVGLRDGMQRMVNRLAVGSFAHIDGHVCQVKWAKTDGKYFPPVEFKAVEVLRKMPPSWVTPGMGEVPAFVHDSSDNVVSNAMSEEAKE